MNPKAKYLLEAGLDILHFETKEWISEVRFYFDELKIFNHLISQRIGSSTMEGQGHKTLYRNLDGMLQKLSKEMLHELKAHETYLSELLDAETKGHDLDYRSKHKMISEKMEVLKEAVRDLKKAIFEYIKSNPFGYITSSLNEDQEA